MASYDVALALTVDGNVDIEPVLELSRLLGRTRAARHVECSDVHDLLIAVWFYGLEADGVEAAEEAATEHTLRAAPAAGLTPITVSPHACPTTGEEVTSSATFSARHVPTYRAMTQEDLSWLPLDPRRAEG